MAKSFSVDRLVVQVYPDRKRLGRAAAEYAAGRITQLQSRQEYASVLLAAAPSQDEFLACLRNMAGIDWQRVTAFQLDEYLGLPGTADQAFSGYLRRNLFEHLGEHFFNTLDGTAAELDAELQRYGQLLEENPPDLACLGVGMNGHLAFNDPPGARFNDPELLRVVTLAEASRRQQVADGCFASLEEVPHQAVTLTIPALMSAECIVCVVPGERKAGAIRRMLCEAVSEECPASILREHPDAVLFLDAESAALL